MITSDRLPSILTAIDLSDNRNFIYSSELKTHFDVFGMFYDIQNMRYRSCLEIVRKGHFAGSTDFIVHQPDAIVVMMNPGSSRPMNKSEKVLKLKSFKEADEHLVKGNFVATHPDPTQYQIERVMLRFGWNHVRVINLSDLREPKSIVFIQWIRSVQTPHSIFSLPRRKVLDKIFQSKVVICGWGIDANLMPLIQPAIDYLNGRKVQIFGMRVEDSNFYRHPSPMMQNKKVEWLQTLEQQLRNH